MTSGDMEYINASDLSPRDSRTLLFYLLYALETFDYEITLEAIIDNFSRGFKINIDSDSELIDKAQAIIAARQQLDRDLEPLLSNWRLDRLGWCTRLILRMALWELQNTDIPPMIIINEAIELAKNFGEMESYKFINGVLDEWVRRNNTESVEN